MEFFQELSPNIWWFYLEKVTYFFVFPRKWEHIINAQQIALAVRHYLIICKISSPLKFYSLPFTAVYAHFHTQFHLNEFPLLLQPPLFIYHFGSRTDYVSNLVCCLTSWRRIELTQPSFFQELPTLLFPRGGQWVFATWYRLTWAGQPWWRLCSDKTHFTLPCSLCVERAEPR